VWHPFGANVTRVTLIILDPDHSAQPFGVDRRLILSSFFRSDMDLSSSGNVPALKRWVHVDKENELQRKAGRQKPNGLSEILRSLWSRSRWRRSRWWTPRGSRVWKKSRRRLITASKKEEKERRDELKERKKDEKKEEKETKKVVEKKKEEI
jgi:hypothetical protein